MSFITPVQGRSSRLGTIAATATSGGPFRHSMAGDTEVLSACAPDKTASAGGDDLEIGRICEKRMQQRVVERVS
jgi:hypothetical protein